MEVEADQFGHHIPAGQVGIDSGRHPESTGLFRYRHDGSDRQLRAKQALYEQGTLAHEERSAPLHGLATRCIGERQVVGQPRVGGIFDDHP